jgi:hypothetical protein
MIFNFATLYVVLLFSDGLIIARRVRCSERVAHVGEKRNADIILMEDTTSET